MRERQRDRHRERVSLGVVDLMGSVQMSLKSMQVFLPDQNKKTRRGWGLGRGIGVGGRGRQEGEWGEEEESVGVEEGGRVWAYS